MKKKGTWKLIIAACCLFCTIAGIAEASVEVALIYLLCTLAFAAWWYFPNKKKAKSSTEATSEIQKVETTRTETRKFVPYGWKTILPSKKNGIPTGYSYIVTFQLTNAEAFVAAAQADRWELTAQAVGDEIHLFSNEVEIGTLLERTDMMRDWLARNDPYGIMIDSVDLDGDCRAKIVFYKDRRESYKHLEQDVVKLASFKSAAKQEIISCLDEADMVNLDCDTTDAGTEFVGVYYRGEHIGNLPKKYADKYNEEGAEAAFVEKIAYEMDDNGKEVYTPYIRIYW